MPHMRFFLDNPLDEPMAKMDGEEFLHLKKVMRGQVGMEIELINGRGALAYGTIHQLDKREALIEIREKKEEAPPPLQTILYQSMPKFTHPTYLFRRIPDQQCIGWNRLCYHCASTYQRKFSNFVTTNNGSVCPYRSSAFYQCFGISSSSHNSTSRIRDIGKHHRRT